MALTVALYWAVPGRFRDPLLIGFSGAFLFYMSPMSVAILGGFTAITFYATSRLEITGWRVSAIAAVIVAVLVFYKLQVSISFDDAIEGVVIPLGLSYYSFRCLHYLIERYKGNVPRHSFEEYAAYLFFLPTLIAGPIHRFPAFRRDFKRKRWDFQKFSEGLERLLYGCFKITVLSSFLVRNVFDRYIADIDPARESLIAYMTMLQKGLNGYLLFSGYSDVAIGFALLLGYRVMENFNWPFIRKNISEFWKSWHISLSSWCREYVYMVVISLTRSPALAALTSMLVLGLWHEVSYRYVLWGLYHGLGIMVWQFWQGYKPRLPAFEGPVARVVSDGASILLTFHFVMLGFMIPLSDSLAETLAVFRAILLFWV